MLTSAKAKMKALLEGLAKLNLYLQEKEDEKRRMEEEIEQCLARMDRANRCIKSYQKAELVGRVKTTRIS